jgi:hypothetical protein
MKLTKNRRLGSSGLNLAFEGLLLRASLRLHAKGTRSEPRELTFSSDTFVHPKGAFVMFYRKPKVPEVPRWRQRAAGATEAHSTKRVEAKSRRHHAGDQAKVAASTPARGSTPLECQKVTL